MEPVETRRKTLQGWIEDKAVAGFNDSDRSDHRADSLFVDHVYGDCSLGANGGSCGEEPGSNKH